MPRPSPPARRVAFSKRTQWDRSANRLAQALTARRRSGGEILDLTDSNPTAVGLGPPVDILETLADPGALVYQPQPYGQSGAREAVSADFARRGLHVPAERLLLTSGTSEAYSFLFKLLCNPGDNVLVPRPSYPLFDYLAGLEGLQARPYRLTYDERWALERTALAEAATPRTRAVIAVHPNNPTGSYLARREAHELVEFCAQRGLALIADEVFGDYTLSESLRPLASLAADGPALVFVLGGLSKSCGLPQFKLAWLAVCGPKRDRKEALARLEIIADTYLSVSSPVQRAAPALLHRLPELQQPILRRVRGNHAYLQTALAGTPASPLASQGGWSAVVRLPATVSEEERTCRLIEERGVCVHPGFFFDFPREAYVVLSLLPPEETFQRGVTQIVAELAVEQHSS